MQYDETECSFVFLLTINLKKCVELQISKIPISYPRQTLLLVLHVLVFP